MSNKNKTYKFYRPGSLEVPGTKISLKTQPYINGVIFDLKDPISSFHSYLATMKLIIQQYESILQIPGMANIMADVFSGAIAPETIAKAKLLLNYLAQSPIEIHLKDQKVNNEILAELEVSYEQA